MPTSDCALLRDNVTRVLQERRATAGRTGDVAPWLLESPRLVPVLSLASEDQAAMPTTSVIVTGELGTGTSELARWIQIATSRRVAGGSWRCPVIS